jgi:hypothetical protein
MRSVLKNLPGCHRSGDTGWCWVLTFSKTDTAVCQRIVALMSERGWKGGFEGGHGLLGLSLVEESAVDAPPVLTADTVLRGGRIEWNGPLIQRFMAAHTTPKSA